MNENENLVPKRRFKEFTNTGTWEQRKLGDIADIKDSARISNELWVENGIPYLRSSDLVNGELNGELFISKETYEGYASKTGAPQKDDVLFTSGGKVGVVYHKKDESPVYVQGGAVLYVKTSTSNLLDGSFLSIYFGSPRMQTYMDIASSGGTIKHFTLKPANASPIIFPGLSEQQKIGAFFKELDKTIALHQRKLEKSKALKSAYLSEMFPVEGERKPKRRFAGFTDDWEQRKLGETVQITMGQSPGGENYTENPKDYILVQGNADMKNGKVVPRVWTTQVTKKADPEDIILSVRAPVGDVGKTDYPVVLGRGVAGIKGNAFIFQTLSRMKEIGFWTRYSSGSTFESINSADLKDAVIQIPNIEEQIKIGEFFTKLDDTIALHQHKLEKLKNIKQAYLNELFV